MSGTAGYDEMDRLGGNDKLNGYGDDDTLRGDLGNDTINGGDGNDFVTDYAGTNTVNGGAGSDTIQANQAHYNSNGISKISAGSGSDVVYAADGAKDTINCGTATTKAWMYSAVARTSHHTHHRSTKRGDSTSRINGAGASQLRPFFLPLFTNVLEGLFSEVRTAPVPCRAALLCTSRENTPRRT